MASKKYRLLELPVLAFFSKRLYRDIGRNWQGVNLAAYLFLLLAICCIPATLHQRDKILQSLETGQVDLLNQIPEIRIQNGRAAVNATMPYYIRDRNNRPLAIIDTSGSMNYIDDATVMVMLTESKLIVRRGRNLFNTFSLSGIESLVLNKHIINGWLNDIQKTISPLSYGIFLMLSYIFAVLAMMLVAVVGLIIANVLHSSLSFKDTMRIAIAAATPAIIVISVTSALGFTLPCGIYPAITLLYLIIGIKSCSTQADEKKVDLKAVLRKKSSSSLEETA
ncbi:DUF1189 family protein [Pontiellaceae bacterium B1224]|nr:DUF1189 family protein [Pontiellaceae bacterium B1224]